METKSINSSHLGKEEIDNHEKSPSFLDKEHSIGHQAENEEEDSPIEEVRAVVPK